MLVLGGTGVFGGRLCRLLAGDPRIELTAGARDRAKVEALAAELGIAGLVLDWQHDLDRVLAGHPFDVLVHVAGPFQGQAYAVAETCIRHGVHYLDLADDRAFVCGIDRLDAVAKAAGLLVCSGASTAPALTGAVLEQALQDDGSVDRVSFGIVPGNDAPRGRALMEAILSGAGKPIPDQPGRRVWADLRHLAVPGLGRRWVAACDLPEPALFRQRFGIADVHAGAGLELTVLHVGLWLLALPVRLGVVKTLLPAAAPLAWIADRFRAFGSDRGGLRIDLQGAGGARSWSLIAEGGDGPFVPATPAAALVRKLASKQPDNDIPPSLHGNPEATVLYNNLDAIPTTTFRYPTADEDKAALALRLDWVVRQDAPAGWKGDETRERTVQNAIYPLLDKDRQATAALFDIIKNQPGY